MTNKTEASKTPPKKTEAITPYGHLFFRRQGVEILNPIEARITLSEDADHLYRMRDKWSITAAGYTFLNRAASVNILMPKTIVIDGREMPNPYVERDPATKAVLTANVRKVGIGYSPIGNITIVDKAVYFNVYTYLIQSIQAKMKRVVWKGGHATDEKQHPNCAVYGEEKERPTTEGAWVFLAIQPPLGLWVNYRDSAIMECLEEHTQRQRFGDRIAQRIVERNILRDHPAIAVSRVQAGGQEGKVRAEVKVFAWRHIDSAQAINEFLATAEKEGWVSPESQAATPDLEEEEAIRAEVVEEDAEAKVTKEKPKEKEEDGGRKEPGK